jgi:hypothetical protein
MDDFELLLDECLEQIASGASSIEECLAEHPVEAAELEPLLRTAAMLDEGREMRPSPLHKARARADLVRHMQEHPRRRPTIASQLASPLLRVAFSLTIIVLALMVSGTAYAQGSVPGDSFYGWKITSERAW